MNRLRYSIKKYPWIIGNYFKDKIEVYDGSIEIIFNAYRLFLYAFAALCGISLMFIFLVGVLGISVWLNMPSSWTFIYNYACAYWEIFLCSYIFIGLVAAIISFIESNASTENLKYRFSFGEARVHINPDSNQINFPDEITDRCETRSLTFSGYCSVSNDFMEVREARIKFTEIANHAYLMRRDGRIGHSIFRSDNDLIYLEIYTQSISPIIDYVNEFKRCPPLMGSGYLHLYLLGSFRHHGGCKIFEVSKFEIGKDTYYQQDLMKIYDFVKKGN
jgi:hypothetical protein